MLEASDENAKHVDDDEAMTRLADLSWTSSSIHFDPQNASVVIM